jgi:hypothetical protein
VPTISADHECRASTKNVIPNRNLVPAPTKNIFRLGIPPLVQHPLKKILKINHQRLIDPIPKEKKLNFAPLQIWMHAVIPHPSKTKLCGMIYFLYGRMQIH